MAFAGKHPPAKPRDPETKGEVLSLATAVTGHCPPWIPAGTAPKDYSCAYDFLGGRNHQAFQLRLGIGVVAEMLMDNPMITHELKIGVVDQVPWSHFFSLALTCVQGLDRNLLNPPRYGDKLLPYLCCHSQSRLCGQ